MGTSRARLRPEGSVCGAPSITSRASYRPVSCASAEECRGCLEHPDRRCGAHAGKRYRLWNVMASSSCAGPVLPPAVRRGACGGRGLPMGSWRSVRAGGSCLAARRRSPVSRASPLTARLGDRADHGDRARGLTAGDAQLRCRGARHVPGLHQRPASADQIGGTVRLLVDLLCHPTAC